MGACRTSHGALGIVAVRRWQLLSLLALAGLSGCKAAPQIAGVITGGAVGTATASPALGFAVSIATDAAAHAALRYIGRSRQGAEQDAIAIAAGPLTEGERARWEIRHDIPIGNQYGTVQVMRVIDTPIALCKEIAFSVDESEDPNPKRAWYATFICRKPDTWKWAAAEPAVSRWGYLH